MGPNESNTREKLLRLIPLVAVEGAKITEAFAERQNLHRTDVEALSLLVVADAQGLRSPRARWVRNLGSPREQPPSS